MAKERLKIISGLALGVVGCAVFVYTLVGNFGGRGGASSLVALANQDGPRYEGQWVIEKKHRLKISYGGDVKAVFDVGAAAWHVRYCVGKASGATSGFMGDGDRNTLGSCNNDKTYTIIDEHWAVPAGGWSVPNQDGEFYNSKYVISSEDQAFEGTSGQGDFVSNANKYRPGGCEDNYNFYRSGLYGIFATTNDGSCNGNYNTGWWAYSEVPLRWTVSGTITEVSH